MRRSPKPDGEQRDAATPPRRAVATSSPFPTVLQVLDSLDSYRAQADQISRVPRALSLFAVGFIALVVEADTKGQERNRAARLADTALDDFADAVRAPGFRADLADIARSLASAVVTVQGAATQPERRRRKSPRRVAP